MQVEHFVPPPAHPLHPFIISIFRLRARDAYVAETLLPRGNVDILFNLGPPVAATLVDAPGDIISWKTTLVCGLQTRPMVSRPGREVHTIGINLRPEAWFSLLRIPLSDLTNSSVDGSLLFRDADSLLNRLAETASFDRQCTLLLQWLMARRRFDDEGAAIERACRLLRREPEASDVRRTARTIGISPRHLHRLFLQRIGVTPSHYARLTRFVDALTLISSRTRLTDVATQARYFDQAHFCRDFRMFAAMTPDEYRQAGALVPGLIFSR
jgi:AraC-like DNA-binding protein